MAYILGVKLSYSDFPLYYTILQYVYDKIQTRHIHLDILSRPSMYVLCMRVSSLFT